MAIRAIAAMVFVAALGLFLSQPLINADDRVSQRAPVLPRSTPVETRTPKARPTSIPTPTPAATSAAPGPGTLAHRYPRACLRPVAQPGPQGLVAAYAKGAIRITTTDGGVRATIRAPGGIVRPPLAWSPSGRILAAGPQGLFWRPNGKLVFIGDVQHGLVQGKRGTWGWSPLADCGVQIDEAGALNAVAVNPLVAGPGVTLIEDGVESFAFSPDGGKLGLVRIDEGERSIWVADLATNRLQQLVDFPDPTCCISLGGWTPAGDELLFWAGPGQSVMADGWPLESVSLDGHRREWAPTVPNAALARCGERLLGLVGGDRTGDGARLALLRPGRPDLSLTATSDRVRSMSCSPDGRFFVVQSDARLALLDPAGALIRYLTDVDTANGQWSERAPEWGPPRTGILFARSLHLQSQLWFIPEGQASAGPVVDLELTGRWSLRSLFDWSATSPTGGASN